MAAAQEEPTDFGFSEATTILRLLLQRTRQLPDLVAVLNNGQLSQEAHRRLLDRLELPMDEKSAVLLLGSFMSGETYPNDNSVASISQVNRYIWDSTAKSPGPVKAVLSFTYSDDYRGFENFFMQWLKELGMRQNIAPPPNLLAFMAEGEEVHALTKFLHRHRSANILYRLCQLEHSFRAE